MPGNNNKCQMHTGPTPILERQFGIENTVNAELIHMLDETCEVKFATTRTLFLNEIATIDELDVSYDKDGTPIVTNIASGKQLVRLSDAYIRSFHARYDWIVRTNSDTAAFDVHKLCEKMTPTLTVHYAYCMSTNIDPSHDTFSSDPSNHQRFSTSGKRLHKKVMKKNQEKVR